MKKQIAMYYENIIDRFSKMSKGSYWIMLVCVKILMDLFFVLVVAKIYPYHYYEVNGDALKYLVSWVALLTIYLLMPHEENSVRSFFLHLQLIIMFLPILTIYAFTEGKSTKYVLMVVIALIIECLILKIDAKTYKPIRIRKVRGYVSVFVMIALPLCVLLILNYGSFNGLSAFDLETVYEIRENVSLPTILSYAVSWMIYIIVPFYIVYCLEKKQYLATVLLVVTDFVMYMVLAHKVIYLSLLVILVVYFISKTGNLIKIMYVGFSCLLVFLIGLGLVDGSGEFSFITILPTAFLGDRFLFGSALNKFAYYEVFSEYPKLYFSDGMIGKCLGMTNLYEYGSGQIAFAHVWSGRYGESNSCTGYLGDGYAQLGFVGIVLSAILLAYLIKYIGRYQSACAFSILAAVIAMYVVVLNDAPLQTVFVSCGMFLFLILLAIYSEKDGEDGDYDRISSN